jgi:outer membrane protein assembly factor BamE (lipoprotein component of BamABCDE complex)
MATILTACASQPPLHPGESEQAVLQTLGKPTHTYLDRNDRLLEYMTGPWGQQTWVARIDPSGKLISYEQVLTNQKFASLKPGVATKQDVLHTVGAPSETSYLPLSQLEVWSYPYKESGVWDSMMHIHFDKSGIVRRLESGPDPRRDPDRRLLMRP